MKEMFNMTRDELIARLNMTRDQNTGMLAALKVARQMLEGTCQHGYDTSRSARGCDECADQIENAIWEV